MAVFVVFIALLITIVSAQDHLWMVQRVTGGYCATHNCLHNINNNVIIHGLWPVNSTGNTITWCPLNPQNFDVSQEIGRFPSDLRSYMDTNWPSLTFAQNLDFWKHEWDKHGACQPNDPHWYFWMGGNLHYWINLSGTFNSFLSPNTLYFQSYIRQIVSQSVGGKKIVLRCAHHGRRCYLTEVIICLSMDGSTYMDCDKPSEIAYDNCLGFIVYQ